jgi:hypothetical protein
MECRLWLRFLLARLQLSYVLNKNGQPNMKRVLKNLPATPDDAYRETMNRIANAGEYTPRTAFRTLAWILHAARPLRMDELREALAVHEAWFEDEEIGDLQETVKQYSVNDILKNCQSLVTYDIASGVIRFTHPTVQPFLAVQELPRVSDLAMTCLTYLNFEEFNHVCDNLEEMEQRIALYKFLHYAAQFWGVHTKGEAENLDTIRQAVARVVFSEGKRNSMAQAARNAKASFSMEFTNQQTWLHIAACEGLATFSKFIFERKNDGYVLVVTSLRLACICRRIQVRDCLLKK